ncbi:MAG: type VI secretion system Vgr family protein [Paracoccaceae bacterium]
MKIALDGSSEALDFAEMRGSDHVSSPFAFEALFQTASSGLLAKDFLGKKMTVTIGDSDPRYFNGHVTEFAFVDFAGDVSRYSVTLRPWLWFLSQKTDNRIFQNMSTVQILEKVFKEHKGIFTLKLKASYSPREYCVQFGESDLDFVQRLMEDEGIFYWFNYAEGAHTMVLADQNATIELAPGVGDIEYQPGGAVATEDGDYITDWQPRSSVRPGKYAHTDYNFEKPALDLMTKTENPLVDDLEHENYSYPGVYLEMKDGDRIAPVRLHALQAPDLRIAARATSTKLHSGVSFKFIEFPREIENDTYIVLRADYRIAYSQARVRQGELDLDYVADLTVAPKSTPFRPERRTVWPVMKGPQTAVVVGPSGSEIYTDKYSRVKVQFFWDREGKKNEKSTCFIRVSTAWAGAGWGFIQIPRIGQEVIVDFLDGNPDRPIITGRVYNAAQMPPYELPGKATQSGWKSNSSLGGGGWNELRFEDKKGSEEVYFQAEKDHNELVKNNESRKIGNDFAENVGHDAKQDIGHDRTETVGNDKAVTVGNNRTVSIGVNDDETVGSNRSLTVGSNETITVGSNSTESIGANHSQTVGANQSVSVGASRTDTVAANEARTVGAAQQMTIGAARTVTVGADQSHTVGSNDSWTVGGGQTVNVSSQQAFEVGGAHSTKVGGAQELNVAGSRSVEVGGDQSQKVAGGASLSVGKKYTIEVTDEITLKCGSAQVTMKKDGTITIKGKDITLDGSGKIAVKASSDVTVKGSKIAMN